MDRPDTLPADAPPAADLVADYAARMCDGWDGTHQACSPLGVWLLLALIVTGAEGAARAALEEVLGCGAEEAAELAEELVLGVPDELRAALAVWAREQFCNDRWRAWAAGLGGVVETGDVPDQAGADAWAAARTENMIDEFPIALDDDTALVLASAVVAKLSWAEPFHLTGGGQAGAHWGVARSLGTGVGPGQSIGIVGTNACGEVAVLVTEAAGGHRVVSVIPTTPGADPAALHRAALEVAAMGDETITAACDWWALPVGAGPVVQVSEYEDQSLSPGDRLSISAAVPAWAAHTRTDLLEDGTPGVAEALSVMATMVTDPDSGSAAQEVVARFDKDGFEAAALGAFGMQALGMPPGEWHTVRHRHVHLAFSGPYAVVAVAGGAWEGVPVFSAWVAEAVEPTDSPR